MKLRPPRHSCHKRQGAIRERKGILGRKLNKIIMLLAGLGEILIVVLDLPTTQVVTKVPSLKNVQAQQANSVQTQHLPSEELEPNTLQPIQTSTSRELTETITVVITEQAM